MTSPLTLGDAALDEDHERLQALIVQLLRASADEAAPALDTFRTHAHRHFATEDRELQVMNDGNSKCHLDEHAAVLKSLDEVAAVLAQPGVAAGAKAILVRRLAAQLLTWLPEHVHAMDAGVASHRSKQRFGGAPVQIARRSAG